MKQILVLILLIAMTWANISAQMAIVEDVEKGALTVRDGQIDVLTYRFGDQIKEGLDPKQTRSCSIRSILWMGKLSQRISQRIISITMAYSGPGRSSKPEDRIRRRGTPPTCGNILSDG